MKDRERRVYYWKLGVWRDLGAELDSITDYSISFAAEELALFGFSSLLRDVE